MKIITLALAAALSATNGSTAEFTDWTNVNDTVGIAMGVLDGIPISFTGDVVTANSITDGTFTGFDSPLFSPQLPFSDVLDIRGTSPAAAYTLKFDAPVRDPIIHFLSLAATVSFDTTNIAKLSGDITVSSNAVTGFLRDHVPLTDANGSVQFTGEFSRIAFTIFYDAGLQPDGIHLQIGGVDPRLLRATIHVSEVGVCWPSRVGTNYQVQFRSTFTTNTWVPLPGAECVAGNGTTNCIYDAVLIGEPQRYYRIAIINCAAP